MNDIKNLWNRVLLHCSTNSISPEFIFTTKTGIEFFIIRIDSNTIHPYRINRNSKLYNITKSLINSDINSGRPINGDAPNNYGSPAPSYRYGLLNDKRIFI